MVEKILPPAIGAFIGYFTNYLAIKMLFWPRRPYYLFGIKLPLTPGLIPSKREKLAEAIGKVVKENLLTEETLRKRLNEERVRESLTQLVDSFLKELSRNVEGYVTEFLRKVEDKPLKEFVEPSLVKEKGEELLNTLLNKLNGKEVRELLPESLQRELEALIDEKLEEAAEYLAQQVKKPEFQELIYTVVRENVERLQAVVPFLPPAVYETVTERITGLVVGAVEKNASNPEFKAKVSKWLWKKTQELLSRKVKIEGKTRKRLEKLLEEALTERVEELSSKPLKELPAVENFIRGELAKLIGNLLEKHGREISEMAAEKLLQVIEAELPVIMESLDVENLVKERINSLPIEEVEQIVLRLIADELKYITLLGGVLGAIIGAVQIII
ncbi:protein of unknown function DUF445 [Thermovibrio ammonificans HB-1]|uniref:DUF445 domain-containing protein n=1 Tax=Thermovibrio ammonificans (strain DSM 15698 / JCM 12110 / HB-1) TaxID=648996 RepID=E8T3B2_THEA1|nr:DUF445 family protein [Thermovibrio ammonificans]ADU97244.1 protein of unknown function DUF445 [Thermovibrio ammonificans HB-1]